MDFIFQSFRGENVFRQEPLVGSIMVKVNGHTDSAFQLNLTGTYPFKNAAVILTYMWCRRGFQHFYKIIPREVAS